MPAFRVKVGERMYEGDYHTAANAVFGAMRFRENELYRECNEGLPKSILNRTASDQIEYRNRYAFVRRLLTQPTNIFVEQIASTTSKKVHRVA